MANEVTTKQNTALQIASVVAEGGAMTLAQIKANRELMKDLMRDQMEEGIHYGVIQGTDKNTLLKPGAELLLMLFRVTAEPIVEDLSHGDCIRYRVKLKGVHAPSGIVVGYGTGECSTDEEKYKWRACYNQREFEATPEDRKRVKYGYNKSERREYETNQIRTNPNDAANTVLKMAVKRAKVDLALAVTAASDIFAQDIEDMAEWLKENVTGASDGPMPNRKANVQPPRQKAATTPQTGKVNSGQLKVVKTAIDDAGISEQTFLEKFGITTLEDLEFSKLNDGLLFCKHMRSGGAEPPPAEGTAS